MDLYKEYLESELYLQAETHLFWVSQSARMPVMLDHDAFDKKIREVQLALLRTKGIEAASTFSTPASFRGTYAEVVLSCVVRASTPLDALMITLPHFYAALQAGELAGVNQWFDTKIHRLQAETLESEK